MFGSYLGILMLIGVAGLLCGAMVSLSWLLGPKKNTPYKSSAYECGVAPVGDARERFPVKFYLVAILFILFDIEVVFLWSWMTVYKHSDRPFMVASFFEFLAYMSTWVVGYLYALRVKAIDWDETTSLHPAKLGVSGDDSASPAWESGGGGPEGDASGRSQKMHRTGTAPASWELGTPSSPDKSGQDGDAEGRSGSASPAWESGGGGPVGDGGGRSPRRSRKA
ncbi:MAG: NADH-quinone oxidoreductase subunit A [Fimbriimonas ginsengisoli]|uniref:NADH-quinone oxidoreductase subunit A n=1 Tax=Fimbriimonas ginsengisoli TaxID=1005039 RepID=A0A931PUF9_FIMGI|nr:NADH-quinone oxidoreductase subunit A [Fimbriimonas ginsengisoli]